MPEREAAGARAVGGVADGAARVEGARAAGGWGRVWDGMIGSWSPARLWFCTFHARMCASINGMGPPSWQASWQHPHQSATLGTPPSPSDPRLKPPPNSSPPPGFDGVPESVAGWKALH